MFGKLISIASLATVIMLSFSSCTKDDYYDVEYMPGLWLVEKSEPANIPISFSLQKADTVRITGNLSDQGKLEFIHWYVYRPGDDARLPHSNCTDKFRCYIKEDGLFWWSLDGAKAVTCAFVKLNKKTFEFDELTNNRRFKMKRLKE